MQCNVPSSSSKSFPLVLTILDCVKNQSPSSLHTVFKYWKAAVRPKAVQDQLHQSFFIVKMLQPYDHFCGPCLDLLQQLYILLVLGAQHWDEVLQMEPHFPSPPPRSKIFSFKALNISSATGRFSLLEFH